MSKIEILHNPHCSKSRQTLELLNNQGLELKITEYLDTPLSREEIEVIASKLGLKPSQFLRKGEFAKLGIQMAETETGIVKQMTEHPILIERPIVINGGKAKIGRPPESVLEIL
ncbi:MAG: arsenate reductase (glutaredoxin) [Fibrobacteria bacterium]|nr:arsenate reductase (glutaredoxin) [Fibrobacteria bacterium]